MALLIEHRVDGELVDSARFLDGRAVLQQRSRDSCGHLELTREDARQLARQSNGIPLGDRPWVLRISFSR